MTLARDARNSGAAKLANAPSRRRALRFLRATAHENLARRGALEADKKCRRAWRAACEKIAKEVAGELQKSARTRHVDRIFDEALCALGAFDPKKLE